MAHGELWVKLAALLEHTASLEGMIQPLSLRISTCEAQMDKQETFVQNLVQQLSELERIVRPVGVEPQGVSMMQRQLNKMEQQLRTGEKRLSNQEQAMQKLSAALHSTPNVNGTGYRALAGASVGLASPDGPSGSVSSTSSAAAHFACPAEAAEWEDALVKSLERDGQQFSEGSRNHPNKCTPCSFYCFSVRGCLKGKACEFCHMLHVTRKAKNRADVEVPRYSSGHK